MAYDAVLKCYYYFVFCKLSVCSKVVCLSFLLGCYCEGKGSFYLFLCYVSAYCLCEDEVSGCRNLLICILNLNLIIYIFYYFKLLCYCSLFNFNIINCCLSKVISFYISICFCYSILFTYRKALEHKNVPSFILFEVLSDNEFYLIFISLNYSVRIYI